MLEPKTVRLFERQLETMLHVAGGDDPEALAQVVTLLTQALDDGASKAADRLRTESGFSWANIGQAFGITRASAQQRFGLAKRAPRR